MKDGSNSHLLWFSITAAMLYDWFKYLRHFLSQSEVKPKPIVTHAHIFPRFASTTCTCFMFSLVRLDCLCPLWLVRVITFVLVLQHSVENCAYSQGPVYGCTLKKKKSSHWAGGQVWSATEIFIFRKLKGLIKTFKQQSHPFHMGFNKRPPPPTSPSVSTRRFCWLLGLTSKKFYSCDKSFAISKSAKYKIPSILICSFSHLTGFLVELPSSADLPV